MTIYLYLTVLDANKSTLLDGCSGNRHRESVVEFTSNRRIEKY